MATQILMPALSPTMTEGKLAKWLKSVGDEVRAGDVIAEIETDKATMEVEAVDEGKLARILVEEGTEGVAVNTPIAVLSADGEDVSAAPSGNGQAMQANGATHEVAARGGAGGRGGASDSAGVQRESRGAAGGHGGGHAGSAVAAEAAADRSGLNAIPDAVSGGSDDVAVAE